jgi:hypothetical protein
MVAVFIVSRMRLAGARSFQISGHRFYRPSRVAGETPVTGRRQKRSPQVAPQ